MAYDVPPGACASHRCPEARTSRPATMVRAGPWDRSRRGSTRRETTNTVADVGTIASPARPGARASACCRYRAMSTNVDARAAPPSRAAATPVVSVGDRKRPTGMSGSEARRSVTTKPVPATVATARLSTAGAVPQPPLAASRTPCTRAMVVVASRTAPSASTRGRGPVSSAGSSRRAAAAATKVTGTVTRKLARHPNDPARSPPRTTPAAPPTAEAALHAPMARARAGPGEVRSSRDMAAGLNADAPSPCTARARTSTQVWSVVAASTVPAVKTVHPATNMRRRPTRSVTLPARSSRPPKARA